MRDVGAYAFCDCKGLVDLDLADGITTIGRNAFGNATRSAPRALYTPVPAPAPAPAPASHNMCLRVCVRVRACGTPRSRLLCFAAGCREEARRREEIPRLPELTVWCCWLCCALSLTTVILPAGLTSIADSDTWGAVGAFAGCKRLVSTLLVALCCALEQLARTVFFRGGLVESSLCFVLCASCGGDRTPTAQA